MKKVLSLLCVLTMVLAALAGCATPTATPAPATTAPPASSAAATPAPTATPEPLLNLQFDIYDYGQVLVDNNDAILQAINDKLKAEINTTCTFTYVNQQNYPLTIASNDNIDLITTFDWMNYWQYASSGAFQEITDDMLANCKPAPFVLNPIFQNVGELKGKRYMIPSQGVPDYRWYWLVRGDLMEKYNIPPITDLNSLGVYLDAVAKNEKGIIPLDISGGDAWVLPTMLVAENHWVAPGTPDCTSPFFIHSGDKSAQLFYTIDAPETKAFSEKMQQWREAGYWSATAMSSTVNNLASFKAGTSACAYAMDLSTLYSMSNDPAYSSWKVTAYPMYQFDFSGSLANTGISIYNKCQNPQRALNVINVLMSEKDLNNLAVYGIEGTDYNIDTDGSLLSLEQSNSGTGIYAVLNGAFRIPSKPEVAYPDLVKHYADNYVPQVVTQFVLDNTNVKDIQSKLGDVWSQYGAVRCMGFESGTVDQAIADEKAQQVAAGVETYMAEVQKQLDAYMATVKQ